MTIPKLIFISSALFLLISVPVSSSDGLSASDRIIASTFKTLAKAYVATNDFTKLKNEAVVKIGKMEPAEFDNNYQDAYQVFKALPSGLKSKYSISDATTKKQAISDVRSLSKGDLYKIIDSIPDEVIANEFKNQISKENRQIQDGNLMGEITRLWKRVVNRI